MDNSIKSVKAPLMLNIGEKASLKYAFNMTIGKEITVSFDYKYDDPTSQVAFSISSNGFSFVPLSHPEWKNYSTTFISQSTSNSLNISVVALQDEAFPIVHLDNITITYDDGHVLKIEDGTEGDGLILQSDALGQTEWFDLRGEIDQKLNDNLQDLEFDTTQNALFIEGGNGVLISSLKNDYGKTLRLSGNEIAGSPEMSLYLPSSGSINSTFHYNADNTTMDWGIVNNSIRGLLSTRWGQYNTASYTYATAWGYNNVASEYSSTSWGSENISSGSRSTTWGSYNIGSGVLSTSWGSTNIASGYRSTAWGNQNNSSGSRSTTWGYLNEAAEMNATSFGYDNLSSGELATSWGSENTSSGSQSTAWGGANDATGERSTSWGFGNESIGKKSTSWGTSNSVYSSSGTAWGLGNEITTAGSSATACGASNIENGYYSLVSGINNEVNSYAEVAFGRYNNSTPVDTNSWVDTDMLFSLGNGTSSSNRNNAVSVLKNGNVGIGKDSPTYDLHLGFDSAAKPGSSSWTVSSDRRLKKDITEFTDGLDIISAIEPVWFTYNGLADIPEETYVGTIAQDLEEIAPYMVSEFTNRDDEGNSENYKAVNYGAMDFVLINAIKEQQLEIVELKAQITEILALLASEKRIESKSIHK
tara:strand:+ start:2529 stop:4463 length:1935 start_codon:yes stop_codon:yes gene_type:complete